jgi:hypothetical protein
MPITRLIKGTFTIVVENQQNKESTNRLYFFILLVIIEENIDLSKREKPIEIFLHYN